MRHFLQSVYVGHIYVCMVAFSRVEREKTIGFQCLISLNFEILKVRFIIEMINSNFKTNYIFIFLLLKLMMSHE